MWPDPECGMVFRRNGFKARRSAENKGGNKLPHSKAPSAREAYWVGSGGVFFQPGGEVGAGVEIQQGFAKSFQLREIEHFNQLFLGGGQDESKEHELRNLR